MELNEVGSWASIIGLAITVFTFFLAANVNKKVNGILKSKSDKSFFQKRVSGLISDLKKLQEIAGEEKTEILYATKQYSKINTAMEVVNSSWDVLMPYDNRFSKMVKILLWKWKFKKIRYFYSQRNVKDINNVIQILNEFITFLEKEQCSNE